ncbi:MAG: phosphate-starvation-inducible PsiE family protein [Candidatus Paceibacterota bacterium]
MIDFNREDKKIIQICLKWFGRLFDLIILGLVVALVAAIFHKFFILFSAELWSGGIKLVITEVLFILILVELFTIMTAYLESGRIKVQRIVEVGIISIIREVMFLAFEISALHILALSALLLVFGFLFAVERFFDSKEEQ